MNIYSPICLVDSLRRLSRLGDQRAILASVPCRHTCLRCLVGLFLVGFPLIPRAAAQTYTLDWFTVAGGGGTSTGSVFTVSGTAGQYDAGRQANGTYSVEGGFWGMIASIQTPGAPLLTITRSGPNVLVSWASPSTGFVLEQNSSPRNPSGWSSFGGAINDDGITKSALITLLIGDVFFRLKR